MTGKKLLAVGAGLLLVLLVLLLRALRPSEGARPPVAKVVAAPESDVQRALAETKPWTPPEVASAEPTPAADGKPAKMDVRSDEFFNKFDEAIPKVLTRNAAKCYEGHHHTLHRNQKLSLKYKVRTVNGQVVVSDVSIKENTINDPGLESCFISEILHSTWKDDSFPDFAMDDELVLRPERGMKKYWKEDMEYVGADAPKN
ncbi:MAG TPA: hypothetical protein VFP84_25945 [Kofleriaceae bacterium]|nr:hypothetical protein [Kofleriaceae bacterium]